MIHQHHYGARAYGGSMGAIAGVCSVAGVRWCSWAPGQCGVWAAVVLMAAGAVLVLVYLGGLVSVAWVPLRL